MLYCKYLWDQRFGDQELIFEIMAACLQEATLEGIAGAEWWIVGWLKLTREVGRAVFNKEKWPESHQSGVRVSWGTKCERFYAAEVRKRTQNWALTAQQLTACLEEQRRERHYTITATSQKTSATPCHIAVCNGCRKGRQWWQASSSAFFFVPGGRFGLKDHDGQEESIFWSERCVHMLPDYWASTYQRLISFKRISK